MEYQAFNFMGQKLNISIRSPLAIRQFICMQPPGTFLPVLNSDPNGTKTPIGVLGDSDTSP